MSLFALAVLLPTQAGASRWLIPATGTRAQGMAGAWVAQGDDLTMLDHNPAGLIRQTAPALELDYTGFQYNAWFDGAPMTDVADPPRIQDTSPILRHIPNLFSAWPLTGAGVVIGAGLFSPVGGIQRFPQWGPQRYQVIRANLLIAWASIGASIRLRDRVTLGISIDTPLANFGYSLAVALSPGLPTLEGVATFDGRGIAPPRAKVGLLVELPAGWSVGAVATHANRLAIDGRLRIDFPEVGLDTETGNNDDQATVHVALPPEFRLGIGWRDGRWRAETTLRAWFWPRLGREYIDLKHDEIGGFELADLELPKHFRHSIAVQGGGGVDIGKHSQLRLGYTFETKAIADETVALTDIDSQRHILGIGQGFTWSRWTVDMSANQIFLKPRTVSNSVLEPVAVLADAPATANGRYEWRFTMVGMSVGVRFP